MHTLSCHLSPVQNDRLISQTGLAAGILDHKSIQEGFRLASPETTVGLGISSWTSSLLAGKQHSENLFPSAENHIHFVEAGKNIYQSYLPSPFYECISLKLGGPHNLNSFRPPTNYWLWGLIPQGLTYQPPGSLYQNIRNRQVPRDPDSVN